MEACPLLPLASQTTWKRLEGSFGDFLLPLADGSLIYDRSFQCSIYNTQAPTFGAIVRSKKRRTIAPSK